MIYNALHRFQISHFIDRNLMTEKFFLFRWSYRLFKKINWSKTVKRNGKSITILLKNGMGLMNFVSKYESWLDEIIPKLLDSQKGAFIDIGANVGQTLLKVAPYYPDLKYCAVEPNSHCVSYLESLKEANHFSNVEIWNYALSNTKGEIELQMRYQDDMLGTTSPSFRKYTRYANTITVHQITGDELIKSKNLSGISIIKMDVEGGEVRVIEGLKNTIKKYKPFIICEIAPLKTKDEKATSYRSQSAEGIISQIHQLGYGIYNTEDQKEIKSIEDLSSSLEDCNYLFVPNDRLEILKDL